MANKQIIRITESELKNIIKESVKTILKEQSSIKKIIKESSKETKIFDIDLFHIDFTNPELEEFFDENDIPESVSVGMRFDSNSYDSGDYYTPESGGYVTLTDYVVDYDGEFKKILPPELYKSFIHDVNTYIEKYSDDFEEDMSVGDYDEPEYYGD